MIANDMFARVNTVDGRRAQLWFTKDASGDPNTASSLAAFTAALGGAATDRADVEVSSGALSAYESVLELELAAVSVSATGAVTAYTPPARVTRATRREELRRELARSVASLGHLESWDADSLSRVKEIAVRCYYAQLVDSVVDSETMYGQVLDTAKVADKRLLAYYPADSETNVGPMHATYRGHESWYAETAPKNQNARRFFPITRSGESYAVGDYITFASAPALPSDALTTGDSARMETARRDCARWLAEVNL